MRSEKHGDEAYLIGLDLEKKCLSFCKRFNVYDDLILAEASCLPFRSKSIDVILASEVIEHLPREREVKFLKEIEDICRKRIIITTPNGFLKQAEELIENSPLQKHKSGWSVKDFKRHGYRVHGLGLRAPILILMPNPIAYRFPRVARLLVAVKDVG